MASATGDNTRHVVPSWNAANTNTTDDTMTKTDASVRLITPRGISRIAVRGFCASHFASARRLNPIAALRAATIATTIHNSRHTASSRVSGRACTASSAPVNANGSAKTEWLNLTNDKYVASLFKTGVGPRTSGV